MQCLGSRPSCRRGRGSLDGRHSQIRGSLCKNAVAPPVASRRMVKVDANSRVIFRVGAERERERPPTCDVEANGVDADDVERHMAMVSSRFWRTVCSSTPKASRVGGGKGLIFLCGYGSEKPAVWAVIAHFRRCCASGGTSHVQDGELAMPDTEAVPNVPSFAQLPYVPLDMVGQFIPRRKCFFELWPRQK